MTPRVASQIRTQIERMRGLARSPELFARDERVSAWSVAEHLDHLYKVSLSIVRRLAEEGVQPSPKGVSFLGRAVLWSGWIPRGRGKTPERLGGKPCTAEDLEHSLEKLERAVEALPAGAAASSRGAIVPHPKFGGLTPPQALRFLVVHTAHHLRIVGEIVRSRV